MSIETRQPEPTPDYSLETRRVVTDRRSITAMFHPLRSTILDLLLERSATVNELAKAVKRPPSSVAYHVAVLVDADLLSVVRTRQVRAVTERFYGRTARVFVVGDHDLDVPLAGDSSLTVAAAEADAAHCSDDLRAIHRHARIAPDRIPEFWDRVLQLANEFAASPRTGATSYGFVAGLYPTDFPSLPQSRRE